MGEKGLSGAAERLLADRTARHDEVVAAPMAAGGACSLSRRLIGTPDGLWME